MTANRSRHPKPKDWRSPHGGSYCGAWAATRKRECRRWPVPGKARCPLHGGLSRGPTSPEGRKRISEMRKAEWRAWRVSVGLPESFRYSDSRGKGGRVTAADWIARNGPRKPGEEAE